LPIFVEKNCYNHDFCQFLSKKCDNHDFCDFCQSLSNKTVVITIFCNFCKFSVEQIGVFLKNDHFLQKLAVLWTKNANILLDLPL
jgi:hypothetical protein